MVVGGASQAVCSSGWGWMVVRLAAGVLSPKGELMSVFGLSRGQGTRPN